jgi:hypothetical protein
MKLVQALITIAAIGVGSQAFGKAYPGLEVGFTFREVEVGSAVWFAESAKKLVDLTNEDLRRVVKLKLLTRGLKMLPKEESSPSGSALIVSIDIIGASASIGVELRKWAEHFGIPLNRGTGELFTPTQGTYRISGTHGNDKKFILDGVEEVLDRFILDYLESNLKYEATLKDKKLRDIDRVIKGAADAEAKTNNRNTRPQIAWYKRYNALMKPTAPEGNLENDLLPRRLK